MIDFCAEMGMCLTNTYFEHTKVTRGQGGVEVKGMIDLVLVKKDMLRYVWDLWVVRGMGRGRSDHHVVLSKFRLVCAWIKKREVVNGAKRIISEKLSRMGLSK